MVGKGSEACELAGVFSLKSVYNNKEIKRKRCLFVYKTQGISKNNF